MQMQVMGMLGSMRISFPSRIEAMINVALTNTFHATLSSAVAAIPDSASLLAQMAKMANLDLVFHCDAPHGFPRFWSTC
jgi:hypothetical protein